MAGKDLAALRQDLKKLLEDTPPAADDGIHMIPLGEAQSGEVIHFGHQNILPEILEIKAKILL